MLTAKEEHELMRRRLWKDVAANIAMSSNSTRKASCAIWADEVLREFDARFPTPISDDAAYLENFES